MAITKIRFRRLTTAVRMSLTPADGEPVWDTDQEKLYIGDGVTAGGVAVSPKTEKFYAFFPGVLASSYDAAFIIPGNGNGLNIKRVSVFAGDVSNAIDRTDIFINSANNLTPQNPIVVNLTSSHPTSTRDQINTESGNCHFDQSDFNGNPDCILGLNAGTPGGHANVGVEIEVEIL